MSLVSQWARPFQNWAFLPSDVWEEYACHLIQQLS